MSQNLPEALNFERNSDSFETTGVVHLNNYTKGACSSLTMHLPLAKGFTMGKISQVSLMAPNGFLYDKIPSYLSLRPLITDVWSTVETLGPITGIKKIPNGANFVWSTRTGRNEYKDVTVQVAISDLINPQVTGKTGDFQIRINSESKTCFINAPGVVITD